MERRARRRAGLRPALLHLLLAALAALAGAQEEVNLCEESWWKESLRPECAAGPALPLLPLPLLTPQPRSHRPPPAGGMPLPVSRCPGSGCTWWQHEDPHPFDTPGVDFQPAGTRGIKAPGFELDW